MAERDKLHELAGVYMVSAREYFYVLRLALYHVKGIQTDSSVETMEAIGKLEDESESVYKTACDILDALYKEKGGRA